MELPITLAERLEEYEIQVALGTKHRRSECISRFNIHSTKRRVNVNGRVHNILVSALDDQYIPRPKTQYTADPLELIEAAGWMTRSKVKNRVHYSLTEVGRRACMILNAAAESLEKTAIVPVEVNLERYLYHVTK